MKISNNILTKSFFNCIFILNTVSCRFVLKKMYLVKEN